jgi:two-component system response regulator YesN
MGRRQILVVEDDPNVRKLLLDLLGTMHEVRPARTGAEALAILKAEELALIVLDYLLPDRTGLEVLAEIKATRPSLPVIMITGYGFAWLCASAIKLGVREYLAKPFNTRALLDAVRRILAGPVPTRERDDSARVVGSHRDLLPPPSARRSDAVILKGLKRIQERYWDRVPQSELARELGVSKYAFSRRFRHVMGIPFRDYLVRLRLEKAKALLRTAGVSITDVAQMVGFGDLPRLDKLFKRYIGVTPSGYRHRDLVSDTIAKKNKQQTTSGAWGHRATLPPRWRVG